MTKLGIFFVLIAAALRSAVFANGQRIGATENTDTGHPERSSERAKLFLLQVFDGSAYYHLLNHDSTTTSCLAQPPTFNHISHDSSVLG